MKFTLTVVVFLARCYLLFYFSTAYISLPGMKMTGRLFINGSLEELVLNCSSNLESIGKDASFIIDNITQEHIYAKNNISCFNSKNEECKSDVCACFPNQNSFIYVIKKPGIRIATYACEMVFRVQENGYLIKMLDEINFNGTDLIEGIPKHTWIIKHGGNISSDESPNSDLKKMWIIQGISAIGILFVIGTVILIAMLMRICYEAIISIAVEIAPLINSKPHTTSTDSL